MLPDIKSAWSLEYWCLLYQGAFPPGAQATIWLSFAAHLLSLMPIMIKEKQLYPPSHCHPRGTVLGLGHQVLEDTLGIPDAKGILHLRALTIILPGGSHRIHNPVRKGQRPPPSALLTAVLQRQASCALSLLPQGLREWERGQGHPSRPLETGHLEQLHSARLLLRVTRL